MKLLSFDVGINNLAYCVFQEGVVVDWGVDDLVLLKTGDASLDDACMYSGVKKMSKPELAAWLQEKNLDAGGSRTDLVTRINQHLKTSKIKKVESTNLDMLAIKLHTFLKNKASFADADVIAIENQPCMKNPTMKSLQIMLYSFFAFRGLDEGIRPRIMLVSATNKTKLFATKSSAKTTYREKKALSVTYASNYVIGESKWKEFFEGHKKKDDLADSLIQGLYVLQQQQQQSCEQAK